jgi:hypothetical protein
MAENNLDFQEIEQEAYDAAAAEQEEGKEAGGN